MTAATSLPAHRARHNYGRPTGPALPADAGRAPIRQSLTRYYPSRDDATRTREARRQSRARRQARALKNGR